MNPNPKISNDDDSAVGISRSSSTSSSTSTSSTSTLSLGSDSDSAISDVDGTKSAELSKKALFEVQCKSENLAQFVISQTLGSKAKPSDSVEETLLRCVRSMTTKHEILFKGMMKRLKVNDETAYTAFITVVKELFEEEKQVVNWGRIVGLYAFGTQLALYCKEKKLHECGLRIPIYVGRYAKEVICPFVHKEGGWQKICEEFPPEDDIDNKVRKLLTLTALGLGLATAVSFLASH